MYFIEKICSQLTFVFSFLFIRSFFDRKILYKKEEEEDLLTECNALFHFRAFNSQ